MDKHMPGPAQGTVASVQEGAADIAATFSTGRDPADPMPSGAAPYVLAAIVDSSDDAILTTTTDGIIQSWNLDAAQFDMLRQMAIASRDAHFLESLVEQFADQAASRLAQLRDAASRGDYEEFARLAHSLKGTSAPMGAAAVAAACTAVEESGPVGLALVATELDRVIALLRERARERAQEGSLQEP